MLVAFAIYARDSTVYERAVSDRVGMRGVNPTRPAQVDAGRLLVVNADRIGPDEGRCEQRHAGHAATSAQVRAVSAPEVT